MTAEGQSVECRDRHRVVRGNRYQMTLVSTRHSFTRSTIADLQHMNLHVGSILQVRVCACSSECQAAFVEVLDGVPVTDEDSIVSLGDLELSGPVDYSNIDEGGVV